MTAELEIWKPIIGYEGVYEVSNLGRLRSLDRLVRQTNQWGTIMVRRFPGKPIASRLRNGYPSVTLTSGLGVERTVAVHRLVAEAFVVRTDPAATFVNHINGQKPDVRAVNLEWVTARGNSQHAVATGLYPWGDRNGSRTKPSRRPRGIVNSQAKLTDEDVKTIRTLRASGMTLQAIASRFPVNFRSIHGIVNRKTWRHVV